MKVRTPLMSAVIFGLVVLLTIPTYAETGVLSIVVTDRDTHQPIAAKVTIEGSKSLSTQTGKDGVLRLSLPTGQYQVSASAPRYRTLTSRAIVWGNRSDDRPDEFALFHAFAVAPVRGQTGVLQIRVRDVWTHYAVRAKIEIEGAKPLTTETDENGNLRLTLPTGDDYLIQISAPGYKTFIWDALMIHPGNNSSGAMLSPIKEPDKPPSLKSLEAQLRPGYTLVSGLAVNEQGQAVADVRVALQGNGIQKVETTTDSKGYFGFLVPTPPGTPPSPEDPDGLPGTGDVIMAKPGYKTLIHRYVPLEDNSDSGVDLIEMKRGSGIDEHDDAPAWMTHTAGTCMGEGACEDDDTSEEPEAKPEKAKPVPPVDSPASH